MPYVYSKSKTYLYVIVGHFVYGRYGAKKGNEYRPAKTKTITICDYVFPLLADDILAFANLNYPSRNDITEKRKCRRQPKTYLIVREVNRSPQKLITNKNFSLGDDYDIDAVEQQIRFFLKKRFGQI